MTTTDNAPRKDPLLDAYRQASEHEGARPGASVRAAVLAHARVVAQAGDSGVNAGSAAISDTVLATPAANESSPIWRLAAGVVIGLLGVWMYQLTQSPDKADTTVASASAPASRAPATNDKAKIAESAPATSAASAPPDTQVATAAPARPATAVTATNTPADSRAGRAGPDARATEAKQAEPAIAMATDAAQPAKMERSRTVADRVSGGAAAPAPVAAADSANSALAEEATRGTMIASAELRKSVRAAARDEPRVAVATAAPASASATSPIAPPAPAAPPVPNPFPAQSAGVAEPMIAAAPPPAAAAAPRASPPASLSPGIASGALSGRTANRVDTEAMRPQAAAKVTPPSSDAQLSEVDQSLLNALRTGNMAALRTAIARGANVNVKDERGRTTIQIARERGDVEAIRVLEASGAR